MGSCGNGGGWFLDFGGKEDEVHATEFIWPQHLMDEPTVSSSLGLDLARKEDDNLENAPKKRNRITSCAGPGSKACREKMRRDRLNDRFVELCSVLDPRRPPKADKVVILMDATRRLKQLRVEAQKLKESNESLQGTIRNLKADKLGLRDEKVRLKAEKDRLEQMVAGMNIPPRFVAQAAAASYHPASAACDARTSCNKTMPHSSCLPVGMWQWIPPASLDTSQDHVLRPPVA